jgi:hypothetical protein
MNEPAFTKSSFHRARWNVMDLITIIAGQTKPAHILSDINMEAVETLRENLAEGGSKVTVTAIILKAISVAQLSHPRSRCYKLPLGKIVDRKEPVAGFTVERMIGEQAAVFFGNIHNAHVKPLAEIGKELAAYGGGDIMKVPQLAKEHVLSKFPWILRQLYINIALNVSFLRDIVNPATFGLTSLGKFGLETVLAPNVSTCIFGVGTVEPRVVVIDNEIKSQKMMTVCFSFDTHVLEMGQAAHLFSTLRDLLETGLAGHLTADEKSLVEKVIKARSEKAKAEQPSDNVTAMPVAVTPDINKLTA